MSRHRIAGQGIESSTRLGRHRRVVERTVSCRPAGRRRRYLCHEHHAEHALAFIGMAPAAIGYRRLANSSGI
ncbi:hypothetical protein [Streptomyces sp. YGL11-2]|uniref:hypothetical protein n=1 Tax=Streptomyces sp. YGL11-2 TaxID=3414028 RepID=UPI003CF3614F